MLDINHIIDGTVIFMPDSQEQVTLYNQGDDILVEYPNLYTDVYNKDDFADLISGGVVIFNEPSQLVMENFDFEKAYNKIVNANKKQEAKYVVTGSNGINEAFTSYEDAELYMQNLIDQGYSEYAFNIQSIEEAQEGSVYAGIKPKEYVPAKKKIDLMLKLQKIAKQFPDVHTRQQALSFLNDLGMQYYDNIKEMEKFVTKNVLLNEEYGEYKDNMNLQYISEQIASGSREGFEPYEFGNWKLTCTLDDQWETLSSRMQQYILEEIAYPVADGHISYTDLNIVIHNGCDLEKADIMSLDIWTDEEVEEMLNDGDRDIQTWISYSIEFDGECEQDTNEQFKLKNKRKKKKFDELKNKEKEMNESYKVFTNTNGECVEKGDFNSWQEVEQYLNREWGSYTNQICKENPSFKSSEEAKLDFFALYDIVPIEVDVEVAPELGTNGTECPICGCMDCICDGTTCDVDLNAEVEPEMLNQDDTIEPPANVISMADPEDETIEEESIENDAEEDELPVVVESCKKSKKVSKRKIKESAAVEDELQRIADAIHNQSDISYGEIEFLQSNQDKVKELFDGDTEVLSWAGIEEFEESLNEEEEPKYIINCFDKHGEIEQMIFQNVLDAVRKYDATAVEAYKELVDCTGEKDVILASEGELPEKAKLEAFADNMGMITDVNDADFPDALQDTVATKEDGSLIELADVVKDLKELKDGIVQQITDLKNDLKLALQDVKQDIKTEVNDVTNTVSDKVGEIPNAINTLVDDESEMEDEEIEPQDIEGEESEIEQDEEPIENDEKEDEELEECYQDPNQGAVVGLDDGRVAEVVDIEFAEDGRIKQYVVKVDNDGTLTVKPEKITNVLQEQKVAKKSVKSSIAKYLSTGFMEDLGALQTKIDQMVKDGVDAAKIKDTITVMADNDEEKKQAEQKAADAISAKTESVYSIKESLLSTSYNSELGSIVNTNVHGITCQM